jgi:hypothetical protein
LFEQINYCGYGASARLPKKEVVWIAWKSRYFMDVKLVMEGKVTLDWRKIMKWLATFTMASMFLFLIVGLIGCGGGGDSENVTQAPSVEYSFPKSGSTLISTTTSIMLILDKDIAPPSAGNFIFTPGVSGSVSYNSEAKAVTYKPDSALAANTPYTLKVQGIKSLTGASVAPVNISFSTSTSDISTPKVEFTNPEDKQKEIGPNDSITVRFTEPINRAKFMNGVRIAPGVDLKAKDNVWRFIWSINDEKEVTIMPPPGNAAFELDTEYTLILSRDGVEDMSGNKIIADYMLTFRTIRYAPEPITSAELNTPGFVNFRDPPWMFNIGKYGPNNWIIVFTGKSIPPGGSGTASGTITASGDGEIQEGTVKWWVSHDGAGYSVTTSLSSGKGNNLNFSKVGGEDYYAKLMFACTSSYVTFSLGTSSKYIYIGSKGVNPSRTPFVLTNK